MLKKILVAMDHSELSKDTFTQALDLARASQAQLMLVHVLTPVEEGYPSSTLTTEMMDNATTLTPDAVEEYIKQLDDFKTKGLELLRSHTQIAQQQGVDAEYQQTLGDAGFSICDVAQIWQADVIVLGRRSRAFLSKLFLGSVSNYVTHNSPCSVFIVHPPVSPNP